MDGGHDVNVKDRRRCVWRSGSVWAPGYIITVSTRNGKQGSAMRSCAHDTEDGDLPVGPGEGLALPMLITFEIFALMTFANEGVSTSSLLRDLLRVDMVGGEGIAWCTSKPERPLYVSVAVVGEGPSD